MANLGRNTLIGPGLAHVGFFGAEKTRGIREQLNLQFRAEIFNLLNRANFQPAQTPWSLLPREFRQPPVVITSTTTTLAPSPIRLENCSGDGLGLRPASRRLRLPHGIPGRLE